MGIIHTVSNKPGDSHDDGYLFLLYSPEGELRDAFIGDVGYWKPSPLAIDAENFAALQDRAATLIHDKDTDVIVTHVIITHRGACLVDITELDPYITFTLTGLPAPTIYHYLCTLTAETRVALSAVIDETYKQYIAEHLPKTSASIN
jgi:hypothetical protein